jgi:hypothetical protein
MAAQDFLLDSDRDLRIENGDLVIGDSDQDHINDIMNSMPGWFKKYPLLGFNPYKDLNARVDPTDLNKNAKIQLKSDGYTNIIVDLTQDSSNNVTGTVYGKRP